MHTEYMKIEQSGPLCGTVHLDGAKNAVLVIMASLILTKGKNKLTNVPASQDVFNMIQLLTDLGATIQFDQENNSLVIDTTGLSKFSVSPEIMKKMRASILVMGPLLARFGKAQIALPGGCLIGARPVNFHLKAFKNMGACVSICGDYVNAHVEMHLKPYRCVLDYPSVGATENVLMAAVLTPGQTIIVNAAIEPEVLDLIAVLRKMGAKIDVLACNTIVVDGVSCLNSVEHHVIADRLEAGSLLLAAAATGGTISIPDAPASSMELFLHKLSEMGHVITIGDNGIGITLAATFEPQAVSYKTMPYPGFPTDLQAPMMAALCCAEGESVICETVFENRLLHVRELQKMGAQITISGSTARVKGVDQLYGQSVIATDIRASAALVIAGLMAQGTTTMTGLNHWRRGYQCLDEKLCLLGAQIESHVLE